MTFSLNHQNVSDEIESLTNQKREAERNVQTTQVRIRTIEIQIQSAIASPPTIKRDLERSLQEVGVDTEDVAEYLMQVKEVFTNLSGRLSRNELDLIGKDRPRRIVDSVKTLLSVITDNQLTNDRICALSSELNGLTNQLHQYEEHLQNVTKQLEDAVQASNGLKSEVKALIAQVEAIPFVIPGSVSIPLSNDYLQFSMTSLRARPAGEFNDFGMSLSIPETTIKIPAYPNSRITIRARDPDIPHPYRYADPSIHPHILGVTPCFGDFRPAVAALREANDVVSLIYLIRQYLSVFDPIDDAGGYWAHGILVEHAPQVWGKLSRFRVISEFVPRINPGKNAAFVVGFDRNEIPLGIDDSNVTVKLSTRGGKNLICWALGHDVSTTNKLVQWMNENAVALIFRDGVWERTSFLAP